MKKNLLLLLIGYTLFLSTVNGQACQWGITAALPTRSQAVGVKEDHQGNLYVASYTDSMSSRLFTSIQKLDQNPQMIWQKKIIGDAGITDVEITSSNHAVITGDFQAVLILMVTS